MPRYILVLTVIVGVLAGTTLVARAEDEALAALPKPEATPSSADAAPVAPGKPTQAPPPAPKPPPHCVGWGIAGALGGAAVGWYATMGIAQASGTSVFDSPTAAGIGIAAEGVGAVLGPIATCRLSKDPRIIPAASFVVGGAIVGGAAVAVPTYYLLTSVRPFGDEGDNPVLSGLTLLLAITGGAIGGGYLGYLVSEAREPASRWDGMKAKTARNVVALVPLVTKDAGGLLLGGAF